MHLLYVYNLCQMSLSSKKPFHERFKQGAKNVIKGGVVIGLALAALPFATEYAGGQIQATGEVLREGFLANIPEVMNPEIAGVADQAASSISTALSGEIGTL